MAVDFIANGDGIKYGSLADGLTAYSVSCWYFADTYKDTGVMVNGGDTTKPAGHTFGAFDVVFSNISAPNKITFVQAFSGTAGQWYTNSNASLSVNTHLVITYNNTGTANDPIFYLNGSSVAITEQITPSGTAITTSDVLGIGLLAAYDDYSFDGKIQDIRIYNRILSADEVATLADSNNINKHVVQTGLVCWSPFVGTAGKTSFNGITLTSSDKLLDVIGLNEGTPVGSPVGVDDLTMFTGNTVDSLSVTAPSVAQHFYLKDAGAYTNTQLAVGSEVIVNKDYISFPRVTTAERDALSVEAGTIVWNTTESRLDVYNGSAWAAV